MALSNEEILNLLTKTTKPKSNPNPPQQKPKYIPRQQVGPLRRHSREMRCLSRRCGCSAYWTVQGVPKCSIHALEELNKMLVDAGFLGIVNRSVIDQSESESAT